MLDPSADLPDDTFITAVRLPTRIANALTNAGLSRLVKSGNRATQHYLVFKISEAALLMAAGTVMRVDRAILGLVPVGRRKRSNRTFTFAGEQGRSRCHREV